jgi:hypothetical protein
MTLAMYVTVGIVILWISSALAVFAHKKTQNRLLAAIVWFCSVYLLLELTLLLAKKYSILP